MLEITLHYTWIDMAGGGGGGGGEGRGGTCRTCREKGEWDPQKGVKEKENSMHNSFNKGCDCIDPKPRPLVLEAFMKNATLAGLFTLANFLLLPPHA